MALPDSTSLAAITAARVNNKQFVPAAANLPRKILLVGTFDPALTGTVENIPQQILSGEDAGARFGFGFQAHRMSRAAFRKNAGIPIYISPQAEAGASTASTGTITITVTTAEAGTLHLYVGGKNDYVPVAVNAADAVGDIATAIVTAITADKNLPVTAAAALGVVTLTAKSKGTFGDGITAEFNLSSGQATPAGVTAVVVAMSGGATDPDIQDALDELGVGDNANEIHFTDACHGYGLVSATLDKVSTYNGIGNLPDGLYAPVVARPMRWLNGDTVPDSAGLVALKAISVTRKLDRTSGVYPVPDSKDHPVEIACEQIADMAAVNQAIVAQSYAGRTNTFSTGDTGSRWTDFYANRDDAAKNGLGNSFVSNGVVEAQDLNTFYHPDDVPAGSNGYRSMRNIGIIQNIMWNIQTHFKQEQWKGFFIVQDASKVTGTDKAKVKDVDAVLNDLGLLAESFAGKGWLFNSEFTKTNMTVSLRPEGNGFDNTFPIILSGQGDIKNTEIQFDINLTVFTV